MTFIYFFMNVPTDTTHPALPTEWTHPHKVEIAYTPWSEPCRSIVEGRILATEISTAGTNKFNYIQINKYYYTHLCGK